MGLLTGAIAFITTNPCITVEIQLKQPGAPASGAISTEGLIGPYFLMKQLMELIIMTCYPIMFYHKYNNVLTIIRSFSCKIVLLRITSKV